MSEARAKLAHAEALLRESEGELSAQELALQRLSRRLEADLATERQAVRTRDTPESRSALARWEAQQRLELSAATSLLQATRQSVDEHGRGVSSARREVERACAAHRLSEEQLAHEQQTRMRKADEQRDEENAEQRQGRAAHGATRSGCNA